MLSSIASRFALCSFSSPHSDFLEETTPSPHGIQNELAQMIQGLEYNTDRSGDSVKQFKEQLNEFIKKTEELEKKATLAESEIIRETLKQAKIARKWVSEGFDPSLLATDFSGVEFAVKTRLIYTIATFARSSSSLEGEPMDIKNIHGKAHVLLKGEMTPLSEIERNIQLSFYTDGGFEKFLGWDFVHPMGFMERDNQKWEKIQDHPCAQLNMETVQKIFDNAGAKESDQYILQPIVTTPYNSDSSAFMKNYENVGRMHSHAFIIGRDGKLWSTGALIEKEEYEQIFPSNFLKTGNCKLLSFDYELSRNKNTHHTIYIPMSEKSGEAAFEYLNEVNKGDGFRFNLIYQNCVRVINGLVRIAGHDVDIKESLASTFGKAIPDLKDFPYVGQPLQSVVDVINFVIQPIISFLGDVFSSLPPCINKSIRCVAQAAEDLIFYIPRKLLVFSMALIISTKLGGKEMTKPLIGIEEQVTDEKTNLAKFQTLYRGFWDLFDEERLIAHQSYILRDWMKLQPSYAIHDCTQQSSLPI